MGFSLTEPERDLVGLGGWFHPGNIGVRDDDGYVFVVVALRPGATTTADELVGHCRAGRARDKVPQDVTFVDALPRHPSGKVLRRELRTRVDGG